MNVKKVLAIDDDEVILKVYELYLANFEDFDLLQTCKSYEEALSLYHMVAPDIVICDIALPRMDGLEGIGRIKQLDSKVKIVVVSGIDDHTTISKSLRLHVNGYTSKPFSQSDLYSTLKAVEHGGIRLGNDISRKLAESLTVVQHPIFSRRENEIANLIQKGLTYKDIGRQLGITPSTVNFHLQNIYAKLNVNSKSEALKVLGRMG